MLFYHSDRNETRKAHICVRGRGPPQVSDSGTPSTGSETGISLTCHSLIRPCWLVSGSQESSCLCLPSVRMTATPSFSCGNCGLNSSLYSGEANSLPTDLSPRPLEFPLLEGSWIIDSVSLLILGSLDFFFFWCCHDYITFSSGTLPISFRSIICWDIIVSPYLILEASWDPLQPCSLGCNALPLVYSSVLVTPPITVQPKVWFLWKTVSIFHLFYRFPIVSFISFCSFFFLSLAPSGFSSPFFYFLWL